jgi:hypothetical protein
MLLNKVQQLALASQEWDRIKKSGDQEAVQKFIELYPDSPNIDDAKKRLDELSKPTKVASASANPSELVTAAQKALKGLGCYSGKEDGVLSDATRQGIDRYLAGQGRADTQDEVTQDFVTELENQHWKKCLPPARIVNAPAEENKKPARQEEKPSQVKRVAGPAAPAPRVQAPVQAPAPVKSGGGGGGGGGGVSGVSGMGF